jgi:RNA polymerase sigma-70 factor, ECF subfamily
MSALEQEIQARVAAGDLAGAATVALRGYGPEVHRFLVAMHGPSGAGEVFSLFAEGIWRGVGSFDWGASFRTYAFAVARRASLRYRRDEGRRAAREVPLEQHEALSAIVAEVRSATASYLRTEHKNRFAAIRDSLAPEERELLLLRVEQQLAWNDCARALCDGDEPIGEAEVKREAARLRKRFQLLKERLLAIGRAEGLVGSPAAREE